MAALFGLAAAAHAGASVAAPVRAQGGPYDGLLMEGTKVIGPSLRNASPLPANMAPIVAKLVKALSVADTKALAELGGTGASFCLNSKGQPCDAPIEVRNVRFRGHCYINSPFFLAGTGPFWAGSARLEWICGDRLTYVAYAKIREGTLTALIPWTAAPPPAVVPVNG